MNLIGLILSVVVSVQMDSTQLWIGQQTGMDLRAVAQAGDEVQFPVLGEQVMDGIEVVSRTPIDTVQRKDGSRELHQHYVITSFKDSLFYIPPFAFVCNGDTELTDGLSLNVIQPFVLDTADNSIVDIKSIQKAPIWWWGYLRWVLLALVVAGLIVLGVWLYKKYGYLLHGQKKEEIEPELLRPADEVALEKLDKIKEEKIWQQGRGKEYHTELTDVVREYISRRFGVASQERTSDEILRDMKPELQEQKDLFTSLQKMLRLADLVKFAKWQAMPDENEQSLRTAYQLVNETKVEETTDEAETAQKEEETV